MDGPQDPNVPTGKDTTVMACQFEPDEIPADSLEVLRYELVSPAETDPTDDALFFEFIDLTDATGTITWQTGMWEQDPASTGPWYATIQVGTGSSVEWQRGHVYRVRIKYEDSPETPVIDMQQITVT